MVLRRPARRRCGPRGRRRTADGAGRAAGRRSRQGPAGVIGDGRLGPGSSRYSRPSAKSEKTTTPPATTYEPPPYSWTRLRTLNGGGVRSAVEPSARSADEDAPAALGRAAPRASKTSSPSIHGSARPMTSPTTSSIRIGDARPRRARPRPVGRARVRSRAPGCDVLGLLGGHRFEHDAERGELEPGDLGVDRLGDDVDPRLELGMVARDVLGRQRLVGEAHVHDRGRVALGGAEVDQPPLGDQVEALAAEVELLDVLADLADVALGQRAQRGQVELRVEVAGVGHDRAVAHRLEVLAPEDVDVAGGGDEQLAPGGRLAGGHHRVAVHQRLERADRVDLDDRRRGRRGRPSARRSPCPPSRSRRRRPCGRRSGCWSRAGCRRACSGRSRSGCRRGAWSAPR